VRKKLIAGNWKMHGSSPSVQKLMDGIKVGAASLSHVDIAVLPPFVYLALVRDQIKNTAIQLGAQNLYLGEQGAFTGEISGAMLKDLGCEFVLVGHSERRAIFQEGLQLVAQKFQAAIMSGLTPILCVGETRDEREQGLTESIIQAQIESVIQLAGIETFAKAVIAYEPVWAIGTGLTATPEEAQAVHAFIRALILKNKVDIGGAIRILYGGSMKPENAASLLVMPDIDGGLIGGASLDAVSFLKICECAE